MDPVTIKKKIQNSIKDARQKGFVLINEDWGDNKNKCTCALGCVLVSEGLPISSSMLSSGAPVPSVTNLTEILSVPEDWIFSFIEGFDDCGIAYQATMPDAWKMGAEIREEFEPVDYLTFIEDLSNE